MHSTRAARSRIATHVLRLVHWGLSFVILTATGSSALAQRPSPHRAIPANGLVAYLEYDGLQLHPAAWKATAAHGLLVDTPAGSMMTELARQILDELLNFDPSLKVTGAELLACHDHLMQHGFEIAVHDSGNGALTTTIVVNRASEGAIRKQLDRLAEPVFGDQPNGKPAATVKLRGRNVYQRVDEPKAAPPARSVPLSQRDVGNSVLYGAVVPPGEPVPVGQPVPGRSVPLGPPGTVGEGVSLGQPLPVQSVPHGPPGTVGEGVSLDRPLPVPSVPLGPPGTVGEGVSLGQPLPVQSVPHGPPGTVGEGVPLGQPLPVQSVPHGPPGTVGEPVPLGHPLPPGQPGPDEVKPDTPFAPPISTWYEGGDLVLIAGPSDDSFALVDPEKQKVLIAAHVKHRTAVLDTIDRKQPNVETNAAFISTAAQGKDIKGFEPNGLFFVEVSSGVKLLTGNLEQSRRQTQELLPPPELPDQAFVSPPQLNNPTDPPKPAQADPEKVTDNPLADLGLDRVKRISGRWGFEGKALFTDLRIEAPAPRKGLVAILDQPTFSKDRLPPLPRDAATFAVESFDLARAYQMLLTGLKAIEPEIGEQISQFEKLFQQTAGVRLHDDLLKRLGPTWTVFRFPTEVGPNVREKAELDVTDYALLASVDDSAAVLKMLDGFAARVNQYFRDAYKVPGSKDDDLPVLSLERLPAPDDGFQLTSPARLVLWLNDVRPTILVGKSFVSCATSLERARLALAGESNGAGPWRPSGPLREALQCLPDRLNFLAVVDHRESAAPDTIANLPAIVQRLASFATLAFEGAPDEASSVLLALGIPRPGGFRVRIAPSKLPTAEQVRSHLFPSVIATTVDERGFRLIAREAFPFVGLGGLGSWKQSFKLSGN